jgi:restriction system protein
MAINWKDYQDEVAAFFRSLGLDAQTDVRVNGVRTHHDVDVVVRSHHVGFDITWLVECKHWQTRVSKLHVLALREIVADVGADRGILLCEAGFQSGALEAATLTNVRATSLVNLQRSAAADIVAMRLRECNDRTLDCKRRYWEIPKQKRIEVGLRPDSGAVGYSGTAVVECAEELVSKGLRGVYPFECESGGAWTMFDGGRNFNAPDEVLATLESLLAKLETLLDKAGS